MAIFGIMSVAASGASAARKKVRLPRCSPTCRKTIRSESLKLKAEGEELNCHVTIEATFRQDGHFTINSVTVRPGEPLCEVVEIFEETLPWRGKLCEDSVTGNIEIPIENVAFFAPIGMGTYEGPLTASGRTAESGRTLTAADLSETEIGTSGGRLTGSFSVTPGLHIQPDRELAC
jgi:hypothetical protein